MSRQSGWLLRVLSVETIRPAPACSQVPVYVVGSLKVLMLDLTRCPYSHRNAAKTWPLQHPDSLFRHAAATRLNKQAICSTRGNVVGGIWRECAGNSGPACRLRSTGRAVATVL